MIRSIIVFIKIFKLRLFSKKNPIGFKVEVMGKQLDLSKNLEEKDGQRQLLYYVSLIRACNKVLYQLVYIGKKFVFLKKNLGI